VLAPARGAMSGVGPPLPLELDVVVVPPWLDDAVFEGDGRGGGGLAETVRTARIDVLEADAEGFSTAGRDVLAGVRARTFEVVACFAVVCGRRVEFSPGVLLDAATVPECSATAFGAARGKPCTIATAAPTANAPPRAPSTAHDKETRRRGSDGASQRRVARNKPSSAAQNATPP
jgi:hypothetical protein